MKIARVAMLGALLLFVAFGMCGCFLLPKEAEPPELPLVTPYGGEEFDVAYVARGDMTLTETISCVFGATRSENLSFSTAGEKFGSICVEVGQYVKAGTLVAELDAGSALDEIEAVDKDIRRLQIELDRDYRALELALLEEELAGGASTDASDAKKAAIAYEESSLDILLMKKAELESKLESRRLYASIDGTVTYVRKITEGLKSSKNETVVTITDMDSSVFIAETELYAYFKPGQEVLVEAEGSEYAAVYTEAGQLGLEERIDENGRKTIYFAVTGPEAPAKSGVRGEVKLFLDSREAVLMLPSSAVFTVDGRHMVYYQDENGVKNAKEVECGLKAGGFIEITGGLNEGDCVIIG